MTKPAERPAGLTAYIAVTAAYWAFMLTDGALRMLVLLHFHTLGFSPVQLAYLFVLSVIGLAGYAYVGPFFGADFTAPQSEMRLPVTLDAQ